MTKLEGRATRPQNCPGTGCRSVLKIVTRLQHRPNAGCDWALLVESLRPSFVFLSGRNCDWASLNDLLRNLVASCNPVRMGMWSSHIGRPPERLDQLQTYSDELCNRVTLDIHKWNYHRNGKQSYWNQVVNAKILFLNVSLDSSCFHN